jgi:hypothetical protein
MGSIAYGKNQSDLAEELLNGNTSLLVNCCLSSISYFSICSIFNYLAVTSKIIFGSNKHNVVCYCRDDRGLIEPVIFLSG